MFCRANVPIRSAELICRLLAYFFSFINVDIFKNFTTPSDFPRIYARYSSDCFPRFLYLAKTFWKWPMRCTHPPPPLTLYGENKGAHEVEVRKQLCRWMDIGKRQPRRLIIENFLREIRSIMGRRRLRIRLFGFHSWLRSFPEIVMRFMRRKKNGRDGGGKVMMCGG